MILRLEIIEIKMPNDPLSAMACPWMLVRVIAVVEENVDSSVVSHDDTMTTERKSTKTTTEGKRKQPRIQQAYNRTDTTGLQ